MTFGDFARNYLNPFFLFYRVCLLTGAFGLLFVVTVSDLNLILKGIFFIIALWMAWIGIKPWGSGKGVTIGQITEKINDISRR